MCSAASEFSFSVSRTLRSYTWILWRRRFWIDSWRCWSISIL